MVRSTGSAESEGLSSERWQTRGVLLLLRVSVGGAPVRWVRRRSRFMRAPSREAMSFGGGGMKWLFLGEQRPSPVSLSKERLEASDKLEAIRAKSWARRGV